MASLGVNVDHVANIREARKAIEPDPVTAAMIAEIAGALGITVHLRGDRRHIQDRDLRLFKQTLKTPLNLEMSPAKEMLDIACDIKPNMVTLVPESPNEVTTEGGLSLDKAETELGSAIERLKEAGVSVSLFVNPDKCSMQKAKELGADTVEIHTGIYAEHFGKDGEESELKRVVECTELALSIGLKVNAGHDLNYRNVKPIAAITGMGELNIGHSIIARSVFVGISEAVKDMLNLINNC